MIDLLASIALKIEADYLDHSVMWSEACADASALIVEIIEMNVWETDGVDKRRCEYLRGSLFEQTYRMRVCGAIEAAEAEASAMCTTLAEVATREEELGRYCALLEQVRNEAHAAEEYKKLDEDTANPRTLLTVLSHEIALHPDDPSSLLDALRTNAVREGLALDDIDLMRQLMLMADDATLQGDVQRARRAAERDIEDDEDYLRSLVELDERKQHEAVSRRQIERDEARDWLAKEKLLLEALRDAVRHAQSAPPPSVVYGSSPSFGVGKTEADRLDAETAKLVAETAMLELESIKSAEEERVSHQRKIYEHALAARKRAQTRKFSMAAAQANSEMNWETSSVRSSSSTLLSMEPSSIASLRYGGIPGDSVGSSLIPDEERQILAVCAQLTSDPCDNARRARAAASLSELCGTKADAVSRGRRTMAGPRAIKSLVMMLNMHVKQPELDSFARALCSLAAHHSENKVMILEAGALPVVADRVSDAACDNRYLVPLWRAISTETYSYEAAILCYADSLVDHLVAILQNSYVAEEQHLATAALYCVAKGEGASAASATTVMVRGRDATSALAGVLERKLHDFTDKDEARKAAQAKEYATKTIVLLLNITDPAAAAADKQLYSVRGAAKTITVIASSKVFFRSTPPDTDAAVLAVLKELFEAIGVVARREANEDDRIAHGEDAVRDMVQMLSIEEKGSAAWIVKEQCCKAMLRLVYLAIDTDKTAAGIPLDANPHHTSVTKPTLALSKASHTTRVVSHVIKRGVLKPLVDVIKYEGTASKRVVFAKQESARLLRLLMEFSKASIDTVVSLQAIPALVELIDVVNKDDPKEAAILALWIMCKDSKTNRNKVITQPNGLRIIMNLVARTGTNTSDEAAARLLVLVANDSEKNLKEILCEKEIFPDMTRTTEWNVSYGDTVHVKSAAKALRDLLKQPKNVANTPKKAKTSPFAPTSQRRRGFSLFKRFGLGKKKKSTRSV